MFNFYYIYDLPFFRDQTTLAGKTLGGWQISGSTFMRTGKPIWVTRTADIAGVGDAFAQPYNQVSDPSASANGEFSAGAGADQNFWFNPGRVRGPGGRHVRQRAAERHLRPWPVPVGRRGVQELRGAERAHPAVPRRDLQLPESRELEQPDDRPDQHDVRPCHGKDNSRRDIQLSLRYVF